MKRNAVNFYLHLHIGHDRRLWRHPTSIEVGEDGASWRTGQDDESALV